MSILIHDAITMHATSREMVAQRKTIAFVPTMGNLHAGHLSLVEKAKEVADWVVVSIFINPTQFEPTEDLDAYPQTPEEDIKALEALGVDVIFMPSAEQLYPESSKERTVIDLPALTALHCGKARPHHFQGVCQIVSKLFHIIQPNVAILGEKDWQQLAIIKTMVKDLFFPVTILSSKTIREPSGLAMSSRNNHLTETERYTIAPRLYEIMQRVAKCLKSGERDFIALEKSAEDWLITDGFEEVDYISIVDPKTLQPALPEQTNVQILVAARIGRARLIDNLSVDLLA